MRTVLGALAMLATTVVGGCGGKTNDPSGTDGAAGSAEASASEGSNGGSSSGGGANGGTGGGASDDCCKMPNPCNAGDIQVAGRDDCPPNALCFPTTKCCSSDFSCCSTTWCIAVPTPTQCDAYPACDFGDKQIPGECPPVTHCYTRTVCGNTINCVTPPVTLDAGLPVVDTSAVEAGSPDDR